MMKKVKIKQLSELELYAFLRQQAREGWFPTSFSSSYIILEESQPQDVIFHFDTFPYTYSAIEKLNKKFPSYLDAFETEGWHYVAHYQSHYLFYSSDVFAYIPKIEQMKFKQFKTYLVHDLFSATLSLLAISFILAVFSDGPQFFNKLGYICASPDDDTHFDCLISSNPNQYKVFMHLQRITIFPL